MKPPCSASVPPDHCKPSAGAAALSPGLLGVVLLLLTACQPDRWAAFEPDWPSQLEREAQRAAHDAAPASPQPPDEVRFELPPGDEPIDLSIEQAAVLALRNNRDLAVRQFEPVIAGTFEQLERSLFDPELFASLTYGEQRASEVSRATGERFSSESHDIEGRVGIRQPLPTGTTVELDTSIRGDESNRAPDQRRTRLGLSVTQALLRGLGPAMNLARIEQARLGTLASRYELRGFTEVLLAEVETAFWRHALSQREIEIFQESLDLARQQRDEAEQRIEVGVLAETEAAAARAEVALREQELIDARSRLEASRLRLLRLINPHDNGSLDRAVKALLPDMLPEAPDSDLGDHVQLARQRRPDLNEARLRLEQNRLETVVTRNGLLPRLDLFIALGKTGFADSFSQSIRNLDENTYDFTAGISFTHLLSNRAAQARDRAARAGRQQAAAAIANLEQLVDLDVRLAMNEVNRARQQITATAATRQLREQTVHAEAERFRVGASTSLLVAQAQRDLVASQIAEVEAQVAYRIALVNLYLAEGTLLTRRGFSLADE